MVNGNKLIPVLFPGFLGGLGALGHEPGKYAITTNAITRFGRMVNGLAEVADRTGIASGYRAIKSIKHNDVNILITQNGTNSIVYRQESGVWATKETVNNALCTDLVSFHDGTNSILAVAYGASTAFRYSTDDGTTWTASTLDGNSKYANYFVWQHNGQTATRILWVRNPNEVYWATSLVNATTVNTGSTIEDGSAQSYFTMLDEDDTGVLIIGKRHALWSMDAAGNIYRLTRNFNDSLSTAGGQGDRRNFEAYAVLNNVFFFIVEGNKVVSYYHGQTNEFLAPRMQGEHIPRLDLPCNAICSAGEWLILAIGSANTATNRSIVPAPGGSSLLQNTFVTTSEIYVGRPIIGEQGVEGVTWYGSELTCTDLLRYMWYDEDDGYLYLASGDSESTNNQQIRCYFFTSDPLYTVVSSNIQLNTAVAILESGIIGADDPFAKYVPEFLKCITTGLASTVPSLEVQYRFVPEHDTSAFVSLDTYTSGQRALNGTHFPKTRSFQLGRVQFRLTGDAASTPDVFGVLHSAELFLSDFANRRVPAGML